jgi:hypothetical protein
LLRSASPGPGQRLYGGHVRSPLERYRTPRLAADHGRRRAGGRTDRADPRVDLLLIDVEGYDYGEWLIERD